MTPEMIGRTIQLILAPVVMFSACSIFVGGVLSHYTSLSDRIRSLTRERLDLLRALPGDTGGTPGLLIERLDEIDRQLPEMAHRHRLIHDALLAMYGAIGVLVLAMLVGVLLVTLEIRTSRCSLAFEVQRVSQLAVPRTDSRRAARGPIIQRLGRAARVTRPRHDGGEVGAGHRTDPFPGRVRC